MARMILIGCLVVLATTLGMAAEPGLVAHWSFDEGQGAVARDLTGHGHDATLKNIEWVPSPRGHALHFDSKDDLARYGDVEGMNLAGDLTLAVWLKADASVEPKTNRIIIGDTGSGIERNLNLRMDGYGYLRFEWADGKRNASLLAPASLLNGSWKHVVVVCDSQKLQAVMYVDGEVVAGMAMPLPISKAPTKERLTGWFYNGYFQGDLDDIRLYSRALGVAEVRQLFESQADVQAGKPQVLFDGSGPQPRGLVTATLRNFSKEPREALVEALPGVPAQRVTLPPGQTAELTLGEVKLTPVWRDRSDLFVCETPPERSKATVTIRGGTAPEVLRLDLAAQLMLEPLAVRVEDPWQKQMRPARAPEVRLRGHSAIPAEHMRQGRLRVKLVSRETGKTALTRQVRVGAQTDFTVALAVTPLPWGAYDAIISFVNAAGKEVVSTKALATILPTGKEQLRVLNNFVTELMDAQARGLLKSKQIAFMNPRDGWVWFSASGDCSVLYPRRLSPPGASEETIDHGLLTSRRDQPPAEAMRLLPAGKHVLTVTGAPTDLVIRAIPGLLYNVYPSAPQIAPFGPNSWERLRRYALPTYNMIESQVLDTPEYREWTAQGKLWIANIQAPGLIDKEQWTVAKMLEVWRQPRGWELSRVSGIQVDEYYSAMSRENVVTTALSAARLSEDPAFAGKLWIPFVVGMYGNSAAELFMRITLGAGWPFSIEVYQGERPAEQDNLAALRTSFLNVAQGWEKAYPGCLRRAIFTPMYAYLPYCTANQFPQADFRVHLDMQMQLLATDPAYFGLWGVQPYRSNYVDGEINDCMARLLRHYCLEGRTDRMLSDPYELKHVADPDFEQGTAQWQTAPVEAGSIGAAKFAGYGRLQGRYPGGEFGDTFLLMTRSAQGPNTVSQEMQGLQAGRLYSLKLITADYGDLQAGTSRKDQQALAITIEGAQVQEGGFAYPFCSARGPQPFTRGKPFWMTYHWRQFRATGPTARLSLSDWAKPDTPGGPVGQQLMVSFVEVQPVLEPKP